MYNPISRFKKLFRKQKSEPGKLPSMGGSSRIISNGSSDYGPSDNLLMTGIVLGSMLSNDTRSSDTNTPVDSYQSNDGYSSYDSGSSYDSSSSSSSSSYDSSSSSSSSSSSFD